MNKKTTLIRVDNKLKEKMDEIMKDRFMKNLTQKKEYSYPECSRLIIRCPSWASVEKELRTLPKRRDK
jgi:hypothetical protein